MSSSSQTSNCVKQYFKTIVENTKTRTNLLSDVCEISKVGIGKDKKGAKYSRKLKKQKGH